MPKYKRDYRVKIVKHEKSQYCGFRGKVIDGPMGGITVDTHTIWRYTVGINGHSVDVIEEGLELLANGDNGCPPCKGCADQECDCKCHTL